jgi:AraC family transcriptional regulator
MRPVGRAIWYIETHFEHDMTLEDVAIVAGVSRFHLTKAFGYETGTSVMRYVRGRRLTEAARALANGESDILGLALRLGYGSHEAFTRAFRDHFGMAPREVRERRHTEELDLVEAIQLNKSHSDNLKAPKIVDARPFLVAGLVRSYSSESSARIPAQWQEFAPYIGQIPGQSSNRAYGVLCNEDDEGNHDYVTGVEVAGSSRLPEGLTTLQVPGGVYAVFSHSDHVSTIRGTWQAIWSHWLPGSDYEASEAPSFELYPEEFDGETGLGGLEIWVPVARKGQAEKGSRR